MGVRLADYKILYTFPVMWSGWECDDKAHIAQNQAGETVLLFGNHGGFYEDKASVLHEKLAEYKEATAATEKALQMLGASQDGG